MIAVRLKLAPPKESRAKGKDVLLTQIKIPSMTIRGKNVNATVG